ncbi:MAG: 3-hydroxyacyl-ACP dehydratase FabZ [Nitrospinota bacterium]|nr:3-hydroxyacyl-ACP dehydratase FabZ [Nitrospinota bacterium]
MEYVPHRHPFLLIDRILEVEPNKRVVAVKNITGSEYYFPGHFPGQPVFPGVLMVEAMAQAGAFLAVYSNPEKKGGVTYFAGIDSARFKRIVVPGDTLRIEIDVLKIKGKFYKIQGRAFVGSDLACEAELLAVVEGKKE